MINKTSQQPVANATVHVRGTVISTQTDSSGAFSIDVPKNNDDLEITSLGYELLQVPVSGKSDLGNIQMVITTSTLNEVFVTGYTSQKKRDITASVSVVNVADMKQTPSGNTEAMLQGQASGVTVFTTGQPGGPTVVQIRGITSSGNSQPLIIIDGVPSNMNDINSNDVESIQILKDAGGATIYGVRGSNGVIIITTKKGSGRTRVSYDGYVGSQQPLSNSWNLANPTLTGQAKWAQYFNDGLTASDPQYGSGPTPVVPYYLTPTGAPQGAPNTSLADYSLYKNHITVAAHNGNNWFNDIFKPALIMEHNVSLSSGNGKSSYFMSFDYFDQQGTLIHTSLQRYALRFNSTFSFADDHIRIGGNAYAFYKTNPGYLPFEAGYKRLDDGV